MAWTAAVRRMALRHDWDATAHAEFWNGAVELLDNKDIARFRGCAKWSEKIVRHELVERLQGAETQARICVRMLYGMEELHEFVDAGGMRAAVRRQSSGSSAYS